MFDFNGDGDVDAEEFDQVALLLRQNTVSRSSGIFSSLMKILDVC